MVNCPYLNYEPPECAGCTGWVCDAFGKKKRLTHTSICVDDEQWPECTRYLRNPPPVEEPEVEEEVLELPPTEEVTSITGVDMETIEVSVEPQEIGALSLPGRPRESVKKAVPKAPPPIPSTDCPYLGPVPPGEKGCCGKWCYAINVALRAFKICKSPPSWRVCQRRVKADRQGVK